MSERTPFEDLFNTYQEFLAQFESIARDWLKINGNWFVPLSGAAIQLVTDGVKFWWPRWIAEEYKKSKESDSK